MSRSVRDVQLRLFGGLDTTQIVNVASVAQRSPFRYPGGKTWLVPFIVQWLINKPKRPADFIEPFAGGAIVGLTVAFERLADHVTFVELDEQVASVWKTIIYGDYQWLADVSGLGIPGRRSRGSPGQRAAAASVRYPGWRAVYP